MTNKKFRLPHFLAALALVAGARAVRAEENGGHTHGEKGHTHAHDHKHQHDHAEAGKGAATAAPMSSHDGMTALYGHIQEIEKAFAAGNLEGIHEHAEAMGAAMKDLDKDTTLTPQKKTRVQGYVKNVGKLAHKMHDYADAKKVEPARKEFEKLKAQVDLLDKQFAHSHKPGAGKDPHGGEPHHAK
jgi:hypothetical protein